MGGGRKRDKEREREINREREKEKGREIQSETIQSKTRKKCDYFLSLEKLRTFCDNRKQLENLF